MLKVAYINPAPPVTRILFSNSEHAWHVTSNGDTSPVAIARSSLMAYLDTVMVMIQKYNYFNHESDNVTIYDNKGISDVKKTISWDGIESIDEQFRTSSDILRRSVCCS